jgi:hypothetical protein
MAENAIDEATESGVPSVDVSFKYVDVKLYTNDYHKHVTKPRRKRSLKMRLEKLGWCAVYGLAVVLLTAISAFIVDAVTNDLFWMLAALMGGLIFWRYAVAFAWHRIGTAISWRRLKESIYTLHVNSQGLEVRSKSRSTTMFWSTIDDVIVTDSYFLFVSDEPSLYVCPVPRRCFESRAEAGTFLKAATDLWKMAHGNTEAAVE